MSYSEVVAGIFALAGVIMGAIFTSMLRDRSETRRRREEELKDLQVLGSRLQSATGKLLAHRALHDDKLAQIDGRIVEKTNPTPQEFKKSVTMALDAFPFPLSDVENLESANP